MDVESEIRGGLRGEFKKRSVKAVVDGHEIVQENYLQTMAECYLIKNEIP